MKTTEKMDFGFKNGLHFHNNYSFFYKDLRVKQLENQNFVVPWQMVEDKKKEVFVE
jgi:hypothetical protein